MIETKVVSYLNQKYAAHELSARAYGYKPEDNVPESYVLIERTSGSERDHISSAIVAIQSIAPTLLQAMQLNEEVKACMKTMTEDPNISRSRLNTDYNFTNPTRKEYRYQAVFELVYFE